MPLTTLNITIPEVQKRPIEYTPNKPLVTSTTLQSFHFFPSLPIELRLAIWKFMLPGPRLIEICLPRADVPITRQNAYRGDSDDESDESDEDVEMEIEEEELPIDKQLEQAYLQSTQAPESPLRPESPNLIVHKEPPQIQDPPPAFFSSAPLPVLLFINSESRSLALKHYTLAFGSPCLRREPNIYINFTLDSLYFPEWVFDDGSVADISPFERSTPESDRSRVKLIGIDILRWFGRGTNRINEQFDIRFWKGLEKFAWVHQDGWGSGECVTCGDRGRPEVLGEVELESMEEKEREDAFGVKETEKYMKLMQWRMDRAVKGKWVPPVVETMALVRDGIRAVWPRF